MPYRLVRHLTQINVGAPRAGHHDQPGRLNEATVRWSGKKALVGGKMLSRLTTATLGHTSAMGGNGAVTDGGSDATALRPT
jgi:hypothetical protein